MTNLTGYLRYAFRQFRQSPVFTGTAVLTLALGIGGTTAIFSLIHAVMLRSLPVADPAALYRIGDGDDCCVEGGPQDRWGMFSYPLYETLKAAAPEFEQVAAFQAGGSRLSVRRAGASGTAKPLRSEYVTGNYFSTLGIRPFGGRLLSVEDDKASATPAAVLSYQTWQAQFGADASMLHSTVVVDGHPFAVVGIAPPGFFGETLRGDPPDLWIPVQQEPVIAAGSSLLRQPISAWLRVIGRLRPGSTVVGLGPRLTGVLRQWMEHDSGYPSNWMPDVLRILPKQVINVVPGGAGVAAMKEEYSRSLQILLAVCGTVLLIACANVANLQLARAVARRGQWALRLAIGANRKQIVYQALIESVLLAIFGSLAGLVVAMVAARLLLALAFQESPLIPISVIPSPLVLAFAFLLALTTGVLFGAAPAWFATRTDPVEALRGAGRSTADQSSLARKVLLVVQVALSVVLVAGATMLSRSLNKLETQNFGYQVEGRVLVSMNRPPATYTMPQLTSLYRKLEEGLARIPGVRGSGLALYNPLSDNWGELILVSGHPPPQMNENGGASWDRVSTDYLQHLGVVLQRGRYFTKADNQATASVAIVNEAFVKRFFQPREDPIGMKFGLDTPEYVNTFRIVGIVRDAKFAGFNLHKAARPMFYASLDQYVDYKNGIMERVELQSHFVSGILLVTSASAGALEPQLTRLFRDVDPNLTINSVRTLRKQVELTFGQQRAVASLAGCFGAVALILAAVGLYGVTSYSVAQRTSEIGVRMALGADRSSVISLVLRSAFTRVAVGALLGVPLALLAGRVIANQLYGVEFWDPPALGLAISALLACSIVAAFIPARFAASISPTVALKSE